MNVPGRSAANWPLAIPRGLMPLASAGVSSVRELTRHRTAEGLLGKHCNLCPPTRTVREDPADPLALRDESSAARTHLSSFTTQLLLGDPRRPRAIRSFWRGQKHRPEVVITKRFWKDALPDSPPQPRRRMPLVACPRRQQVVPTRSGSRPAIIDTSPPPLSAPHPNVTKRTLRSRTGEAPIAGGQYAGRRSAETAPPRRKMTCGCGASSYELPGIPDPAGAMRCSR